jgi:hypothetical protein
VRIPASPQDLTPAWFTKVLGEPVTGVEILDAHSGTTGRARVALTTSADLPATVFVKLQPFTPEQRKFLRQIGLGVAEARLYAAVLPRSFDDENCCLVICSVRPLKERRRPLHATADACRDLGRRNQIGQRLSDGLPHTPGVVAEAEPLFGSHRSGDCAPGCALRRTAAGRPTARCRPFARSTPRSSPSTPYPSATRWRRCRRSGGSGPHPRRAALRCP